MSTPLVLRFLAAAVLAAGAGLASSAAAVPAAADTAGLSPDEVAELASQGPDLPEGLESPETPHRATREHSVTAASETEPLSVQSQRLGKVIVSGVPEW